MIEVNLKQIFDLQEKLDQHIHTNHHITYNDVQDELVLALAVEISELANEVRCFKFWSKKPSSERKVILEEYVDGIHFITAIALSRQLVPNNFMVNDINLVNDKKSLTKIFNSLYQQMGYLYDCEHIKTFYEQYLSLGYALGFNIDEIKEAYLAKNQINHDRQNNNY
ncbi:dimeric dUTPase [Candidatus Malacoplasma girerdii]|uniref:Dimeric dUTPase n=1 Tax=Candidatus Malacoplasma girerdii TaxID=1318617 RepID=A0A097SSB8_9BACT|nr:dimeric dUTPase [Candidatus Malacoplasma girerdii]ASJ89138.1 MAG: deoxyuridine 5'-triphosphate nucleotidohydrolase [Candidatus Malacoplasma girerdii]